MLNKIDNSILLSFRAAGNTSVPIGPAWLVDFMQDVSSLGSVTVVIIITVLTSGLLILKREYRSLKVILIAVIAGGTIDLLMKVVISRQRPQLVTHLAPIDSFSFPSGHSAMSAIIYLSLLSIIFTLDLKRSIKIYFLFSAVILIFLVGISRIYLGVHYPSDVLGGWMLGLSWSSISNLLVQKSKYP
jgi:undecaprenyl-diphosphatase